MEICFRKYNKSYFYHSVRRLLQKVTNSGKLLKHIKFKLFDFIIDT